MKEKTFYEWAMDELNLARKAAKEIGSVDGATGVEIDISNHRLSIVALAREITCRLVDHDQGGIESYAALKIIKKLFDREPLTAVTDESDQWKMVYPTGLDQPVSFQHVRNAGLFKICDKDGNMQITDIDRVHYANVREDETDFSYRNTHLTRLIDTAYVPITFPYTAEKIRVRVDRVDGYAIREDLPLITEVISFSINGGPFKKIGRYYRYNFKTDRWDEISPFTYHNHKSVIESIKTMEATL